MAISAITVEMLKEVATRLNVNLVNLVSDEDNNLRKHELAKLLPALNEGEVNQSSVLKFAKEHNTATNEPVISSATLNNWVKELNSNNGVVAESAAKSRGRKPDSTITSEPKITIPADEYNQLKTTANDYDQLMMKMAGMMLVSDQDAYVLDALKEDNPEFYNNLIETAKSKAMEAAQNAIKAAMAKQLAEEEQRILARFQLLPVGNDKQSENHALLPDVHPADL